MPHALRSIKSGSASSGILAFVWVAMPWGDSAFLEWWLEQQGYQKVTVQLGYPDLRSMAIPVIELTRRLGDEDLSSSLRECRFQYRLYGLLAGQFEMIVFPAVSIELKASTRSPPTLPSGFGGTPD